MITRRGLAASAALFPLLSATSARAHLDLLLGRD
jgi:hypothetical protein